MTGIFHQADVGAFNDFPRIAIGQVHQFQIGHFITPYHVWMDRQGKLWSIAKIKTSNCFLKFEVEKSNQI